MKYSYYVTPVGLVAALLQPTTFHQLISSNNFKTSSVSTVAIINGSIFFSLRFSKRKSSLFYCTSVPTILTADNQD